MAPHFKTVENKDIGFFHTPFSWNKEDAIKSHNKAQEYANEHQIVVVEVGDGRGQSCSELSQEYKPKPQPEKKE